MKRKEQYPLLYNKKVLNTSNLKEHIWKMVGGAAIDFQQQATLLHWVTFSLMSQSHIYLEPVPHS